MAIINFIYCWLVGSICIFIFTFYSKVSLDYTNNKLEKEIRMNNYDIKEIYDIKINK